MEIAYIIMILVAAIVGMWTYDLRARMSAAPVAVLPAVELRTIRRGSTVIVVAAIGNKRYQVAQFEQYQTCTGVAL